MTPSSSVIIYETKRTRVPEDPNYGAIELKKSGLRSLEIAFPPHDSSNAGSNPAEVVEFLRTDKFREQVLRRDFKLFDPCSKFTAR
jgi:hypothetical protein